MALGRGNDALIAKPGHRPASDDGVRPHHLAELRTPAPGNARRVLIANFDTFREETIRRINGSMVHMPHDWQDNSVPDPVKDQQPADDCVVPGVLEPTQLDNWRQQLTLIRGEILEIAEQGCQQGLVDLQQETVRLAEAIELLEVFLGRKAPH